MRSFTHACGTHTRAVSLSPSWSLSLVGPCCPAKRMLCMCFAPFLHDKGRRCCSEREAKSGKGREQIQFIFNIIFIVAAARDAEPKNRTEPNRTEPKSTGRGTNRSRFGMQCAMRLKVFLLLLPPLFLRLAPLLHFVVSSAVPAKLLFLMASS